VGGNNEREGGKTCRMIERGVGKKTDSRWDFIQGRGRIQQKEKQDLKRKSRWGASGKRIRVCDGSKEGGGDDKQKRGGDTTDCQRLEKKGKQAMPRRKKRGGTPMVKGKP